MSAGRAGVSLEIVSSQQADGGTKQIMNEHNQKDAVLPEVTIRQFVLSAVRINGFSDRQPFM